MKTTNQRLKETMLVLLPPVAISIFTVVAVAFVFASQGYECNNSKQPPIIPELPRTNAVPK